MPLPALRTRAGRLRRPVQFLVRGSDERIIWAIEATGRRLGRLSTCLLRALVAELLLETGNGTICLTIGIRRTADTLEAHAWLARDGRVLIGAPADEYIPMVDWTSPPASRSCDRFRSRRGCAFFTMTGVTDLLETATMAPPASSPEPGRAIDTASTGWSSRATRHSTCRQTRTAAWPGWSCRRSRHGRFSQRRRGGDDGDTNLVPYVVLRDGSTYVRWRAIGEFLVAADGRRIMFRRSGSSLNRSRSICWGRRCLSRWSGKASSPCTPRPSSWTVAGVAFLGSNAFGKSSLAACFLEAGARLLTDDLLILRESGNRILAYPGPPRLKLFPKIARRFLGQDVANRVHMNPDTDKLILPIEEHRRQGRPLHSTPSTRSPPRAMRAARPA